MNKRGVEFSIGFVVMLIISILIFSLSVYVLFKWFAQVEDTQDAIDRKTADQIKRALRSGNQLVVIPFPVRVGKRGQNVIFSVGVRNPGPAKEFSMSASFSNAYTPDGKLMSVDPDFVERWLGSSAQTNSFLVDRSSEEVKPLLLKVGSISSGKSASLGDYVFDVCVFDQDPVACDADSYLASGREKFYSGRIYQITVRVR